MSRSSRSLVTWLSQLYVAATVIFVDEFDAPDRLFFLQAFIARLSKSNSEASAVFIEKFDTRGLNSFLQLRLSIFRYAWAKPPFETLHRRER